MLIGTVIEPLLIVYLVVERTLVPDEAVVRPEEATYSRVTVALEPKALSPLIVTELLPLAPPKITLT